MANRSPLGGSPLNLIGLRSAPTNGSSSFNGGASRDVDVKIYNESKSTTLFSGRRNVRAWPNVTPDDTLGTKSVNQNTGQNVYSRKELHNDTIYDTSILNIIEKLSNTKAQLKPADFAYLKNVGVFPNNRLMVARRFASPSMDNIMVKKADTELSALAVLISWLPENQDFLDISFGEEWTDAEADFKGVLSSLGEDVGMSGVMNLGGVASAGGNLVPLPGFTEGFQRILLEKIGILDSSDGGKGKVPQIPVGNPNLIKQAKRRKLVGYSEAGSGLKCTVSIKMVCEYELKYISGIDPTIVWMDLIGSILRFSTSSSETYGLGTDFSKKATAWLGDTNQLIMDFSEALGKAMQELRKTMFELIGKLFNPTNLKDQSNADQSTVFNGITNDFGNFAWSNIAINTLVYKYRVKFLGIINALSGLPSTPWHITIGNPMRPVFCSGDMLTDNVQMKLGPQLYFNDLPSSITVEFTLSNARPWGLQEIMAKFNSGYLRTVDIEKTFYETSQGEPAGSFPFVNPTGNTQSNSGATGVNTTTNSSTQTTASNMTKSENGQNQNKGSIVRDGNSNLSIG